MIRNELKDSVLLVAIRIRIKDNPEQHREIHDRLRRVAESYAAEWETPADALELLQPARRIYKQLGIDPTRYRPSSEALFRRAVKGKEMPAINAAVDAGNYISLRYLLPLGLYDVGSITGDIVLRKGKEDEFYEGLGKPRVSLRDKYVLADGEGPFGNPSSDSLRTSVSVNSRDLLMVVFCPLDFKAEKDIFEDVREIYGFLGGEARRVQ